MRVQLSIAVTMSLAIAPTAPEVLSGFALLRHLGFNPSGIIDAGANRGKWTRDMRKIFPEARYLLIEGNSKHAAALSDLVAGPKVHVAYTILDREQRAVGWHTRGDNVDTGDSIFLEATKAYDHAYTLTRNASSRA